MTAEPQSNQASNNPSSENLAEQGSSQASRGRLPWLGLLLLGGIGGVVCLPPLLGTLSFFVAMNETDLVLEAASPDGDYRLVVESSAGWVYAPHSISVYQASDRGRRKRILGTSLYNDGANLGENNVQLTWQSDRQTLLRLEGEEQAPACHLLTLGKSPRAEDVPCPMARDAAGDESGPIPEPPVVPES